MREQGIGWRRLSETLHISMHNMKSTFNTRQFCVERAFETVSVLLMLISFGSDPHNCWAHVHIRYFECIMNKIEVVGGGNM